LRTSTRTYVDHRVSYVLVRVTYVLPQLVTSGLFAPIGHVWS
jgi:hypothetical protein